MKYSPKVLKILAKMQEKGIKIDRDPLAKIKGGATARTKRLKDKMFTQMGRFNLDSPRQVGEVLFDILKLPPIKKSGEHWSTDDEVLEVLAEDGCQMAEDLRNYRRIQSLIQACREIEKNLDQDSLCHPNYSPDNSTGRVYYSKPAIQQVPSELRQVVVAREGKVFILADYKQIDVRMIAHFSKDRNLIEAFEREEDVYDTLMKELRSVDRDMAKEIFLSIPYGRGCLSLSRSLHISQVEAQKYIDKFFNKYREVKNFIDHTIDDASRLGYVRTLGGGEIEVDRNLSKSEIRRKAIARKIQGSTADLVIRNAMAKVHDAIQQFDSNLVLQVHDELIIEAPVEAERYVKEIVKEKMEHAVELNVPLKVDIATGKSWK